MALAGVYLVGMKLAVGWANRGDAGLVVGLLVGGLTLGSASPHLVNALGRLAWRMTLAAASFAAIVAAGLINLTDFGPRHASAMGFQPAAALQLWRNPGTRLATLGYLGHMWAWVGLYLTASFAAWRGHPEAGQPAWATFAVIVSGAVGCVAAGLLAHCFGRVRVTLAAMAVSATCCMLAGPAFGLHPTLTTTLCLV